MLLLLRTCPTLSVALTTLLLLGCTAQHPAAGASPSADAQVAIEVENHNWADVVVYLVRGGQRSRLGLVSSLNKGVFTVPFRQLSEGTSRLQAHPIGGGRDVTSDHLLLQAGQAVQWTLESDLSRSSLGVY